LKKKAQQEKQLHTTMNQQKQQISIKGSSKIVSEFFCYAVQAILYLRGVYPDDQFERKQEYDIPLQVSKVRSGRNVLIF
jgi:hypothetical protein